MEEGEKHLDVNPQKSDGVEIKVAQAESVGNEPKPPYFATKVKVEYVNGFSWLLLEELVYYSCLIGRVQIPSKFMTDFNSVPRPLWRVFPKTQYGPAAVVHDYLCNHGLKQEPPVDRKTADQVFEEALKVCGAPWWKRKAMYIGVRIGAKF